MSVAAKLRVLSAEGCLPPPPIPWRLAEEIDHLKRCLLLPRGWSFSGGGRHSRTWEQFQREAFERLREVKKIIARARRTLKMDVFRKLCDEVREIIRLERKRSREAYREFEAVGRRPFLVTTARHAGVNMACYAAISRRLTYFRLSDRLAISRNKIRSDDALRAAVVRVALL